MRKDEKEPLREASAPHSSDSGKPFAFSYPRGRYAYKMQLPGILRVLVVFLFILAVFILVVKTSQWLSVSFFSLTEILRVLSSFFALYLLQKESPSAYTIIWVVMLLLSPVIGFILYAIWGHRPISKRGQRQLSESWKRLAAYLPDPIQQCHTLAQDNETQHSLPRPLHFLLAQGYPAFTNSNVSYFPHGEDQFAQIMEDLRSAQQSILLEYYILSDGYLWEQIEQILIEKAAQGLDVRLMIDDFGSAAQEPRNLEKNLQSHGIRVTRFNPILRYLGRIYVNFRNHQKNCLIDGEIAWFGGCNIGDEYANLYQRFGYWKDGAIRVQGEAARGAILGFLLMWELENGADPALNDPLLSGKSKMSLPALNNPRISDQNDTIKVTKDQNPTRKETTRFCVPYWDGPLFEKKETAFELYLSLITGAQKTLYIVTPYFIPDDRMIRDLCRAGRAGVDVRLLIPGIPDKKSVYDISVYNLGALLKSHVRVFSYSPGFVHSKTMIVDGKMAVMGSINLDFRSLFLNYENAVFLLNDPVIQDLTQDFLQMESQSHEVTFEEWAQRPKIRKIRELFFKIFSPFL